MTTQERDQWVELLNKILESMEEQKHIIDTQCVHHDIRIVLNSYKTIYTMCSDDLKAVMLLVQNQCKAHLEES